jgi:hypothetical protein
MSGLTHKTLREIQETGQNIGLCLFPDGRYLWTRSDEICEIGYVCAAWHLEHPECSVSINYVDVLQASHHSFPSPKVHDSFADEEEVSWDLLYRKVCAFTLEARFEKSFLMTDRQVYSA